LVAGWRRIRASDISVLWADFGQGKTHALLHVENELESDPKTLVHYVQLPPLTTGSPFVALYRQVLRDFPLETLGRRVFERYRDSPQDLFRGPSPGERPIHQLLWLVGTSGAGKEVATRWLRGDKVSATETSALVIAGKHLAVGASPQNAQDCENVLDALVKTATDFPTDGAGQFVLLIDEFQRVGELTTRKRTEVCDALHLLFNRHPQGFRLVLAFAGGLPEVVGSVLTLDLQARVMTRLNLPPMTPSQGVAYLVGLIEAYAAQPQDGANEPFPYGPGALEAIVGFADTGTEGLSPRRLNITANMLSFEALAAREEGEDGPLSKGELAAAYDAQQDELSSSLAAED
jgi:hypothetical protein